MSAHAMHEACFLCKTSTSAINLNNPDVQTNVAARGVTIFPYVNSVAGGANLIVSVYFRDWNGHDSLILQSDPITTSGAAPPMVIYPGVWDQVTPNIRANYVLPRNWYAVFNPSTSAVNFDGSFCYHP